MDAVIDIRNVTKKFRGKPVVDQLNLQIPRGAIYALLGDNGAGKTTTIRMLTGLLKPDDGAAFVLGQNCWKSAVALRHKIGYVPERPRFYDWMTIADIGWFSAGFHRAEYLDNYQQWLEKFQLDPKASLSQVSKGQYAKVGLALSLAADPEVLILDEPTSGLDLLVRREFLRSMVALAADGRTILISSHQIAEIERVASHAAFLSKGQLLLAGSLDEIRARLVRVRLRFNQHPPEAAALGRVLERNGIGRQWQATLLDPSGPALDRLRHAEDVSEFEQGPLTLEEAYCALLTQRES